MPSQTKPRRRKFDQFEGEDKNSLLELEREHKKKGYVVVAHKRIGEPIEGIPHFDTVLVGLLNGKPTFSFIKRKDSGKASPKFRADSGKKQEKPPVRQSTKAKKPAEGKEKKPKAKSPAPKVERKQQKTQGNKKEKPQKKSVPKPSRKKDTREPTKKSTKSKTPSNSNRSLYDFL